MVDIDSSAADGLEECEQCKSHFPKPVSLHHTYLECVEEQLMTANVSLETARKECSEWKQRYETAQKLADDLGEQVADVAKALTGDPESTMSGDSMADEIHAMRDRAEAAEHDATSAKAELDRLKSVNAGLNKVFDDTLLLNRQLDARVEVAERLLADIERSEMPAYAAVKDAADS